MTSQDTEALRALVALAKKATPGPWEVERPKTYFRLRAANGDIVFEYYPAEYRFRDEPDAEFCAAARNAIPAIERMLAAQTAGMDVDKLAWKIVTHFMGGNWVEELPMSAKARAAEIAAIIRKHCP